MNYYNVNGHDINAAQFAILKKAYSYHFVPKGSTGVKALPLHRDEKIQSIYGDDKATLTHDVMDLVKKGLIRYTAGTGGAMWAEATPEGLIASEPSKSPLRVGYNRPAVSNAGDNAQSLPSVMQNALQTLADTPLVVNEEMRTKLAKTNINGWTNEERAVVKGLLAWDGPIYSEAFCDWRGRAYNQSGMFGSYTQSKINRAILDAPEATPIKWGSKEYKYLITITDHEFGVNETTWKGILDKPITEPADLSKYRAALAIQEIKRTNKTAYMVEQDASCSGAQFVAMLQGDTKLAKYTNLLPDSIKHDLYNYIVEDTAIQGILKEVGITRPKKIRNAAKPVVMLSFYGAQDESIAMNIWLENEGPMDEGPDDTEVPHPTETMKWLGGTWTWRALNLYTQAAGRRLQDEFPSFTAFKARMASWFQQAQNCKPEDNEFVNIEWVTPNGWLVERNLQAVGPVMPCFVHSLDAAVVHRVINQCAAEGITIKTVHDAFFTTPTHALRLREIVAQCYASVIRDTANPYEGTRKDFTEPFQYNNSMLDNLKDSSLIGEILI